MISPDPHVRPVELTTDDESGLIATAFRRPSLAWRLEASRDGVRQLAYELQRCAEPSFAAEVIATGRIGASVPFGADWPGPGLASREVAWCRVRVWTDAGLTAWSEPLRIEGALFEPGDWRARPISPRFNVGQVAPAPVPLLRRSFTATGPIASARLYVTALGVQQVWINGMLVSADLLEPGWSEYRQRLLYSVHDVTALLREGDNVLATAVGDGWWRGNLTWMGKRAVYGETTALLAQLELTYADGGREVIATDEHWRGGEGELRRADIYNGCEIDLAHEPPGWREAGFDDGGWSAVDALPLPTGLEQRSAPPVREVSAFEVVAIPAAHGGHMVDCGQNLTGYLRLTVEAEAAGTITVRHAEVLEPDGGLHTAALRKAKATDSYSVPAGTFVLAPSFTYHGFRHAEIAVSEGVRIVRVEACVVASDLAQIGAFACSDPRLDQLFSNIVWSQRGNFVALPTDCPQRDERLGWTGDIQVFAPTACANFASRGFLAGWLVDLALDQAPDGRVPSTVPNVIAGHPHEFAGVGWGDAATLVPWALYEAYGDRAVLARQFASMRRWIDWGASRLDADGVWSGDSHLGDWLDPGAPPDRPEEATTDRDFIASAYLAHSADRLARSAQVLGLPDEAQGYARLSERVAQATWRRWRESACATQTGCAMAIVFGIAPEAEIAMVGARLAALVESSDGRIATGFLGTPLVLPALTRAGEHAAAYRLLLNERCPGWLYQVLNGATTMWERWDAIEPGGGIHRGAMAAGEAQSMTSFNHYAYGSVGAWLYRSLAGIAPGEAGYQTIAFRPQPGGAIDWARASIETPFGRAAIRWEERGDTLTVALDVPAGADAVFQVPEGWQAEGGQRVVVLASGAHAFDFARSGGGGAGS